MPNRSDNSIPAKEPHPDCPYYRDARLISSELRATKSALAETREERMCLASDIREAREASRTEREQTARDISEIRADVADIRADVGRLVSTVDASAKMMGELDAREQARYRETKTINAAIEAQRLANDAQAKALRVKIWIAVITVLGALAGTAIAL